MFFSSQHRVCLFDAPRRIDAAFVFLFVGPPVVRALLHAFDDALRALDFKILAVCGVEASTWLFSYVSASPFYPVEMGTHNDHRAGDHGRRVNDYPFKISV